MNTPTPLFPMETKTESGEEYVRRLIEPKLKQVLQETNKNQVLVGGLVSTTQKLILYQPHNFRRYFDFDRTSFKIPNQPQEVGGGVGHYTYKVINKKEYYFQFKEFSLRVKKNQIQINNEVNHKNWYSINIDSAAKEIFEIVKTKEEQCINTLKEFIKVFGGYSKLIILKRHSEDKIQNDNIINQLPVESHFYNQVGKKVYNENNFEFTSPALASNYIENQALESNTPKILKAIEDIKEPIELKEPLRLLKSKCYHISDVMQHKHIIRLLTKEEKDDFSLWCFNELCYTH